MPLFQVMGVLRASARDARPRAGRTSTHIGSQITDTSPFTEAAGKVAAIVKKLRSDGIVLKDKFHLGGGLGIPYQEEPPQPAEYAKAILAPIAGLDSGLNRQPGRVIVGNAGVFVTRALYIKETDVPAFCVIVDAR